MPLLKNNVVRIAQIQCSSEFGVSNIFLKKLIVTFIQKRCINWSNVTVRDIFCYVMLCNIK